jgi:alginate O-acetyltransferase complex protein AlgI
MLFNTTSFFILLCVTFILYYLPLFRKLQVIILVAASFIFYAYSYPWFLALLLGSVAINSYTSWKVFFGAENQRKFWATSGVIANLLLLIFFKYSPFISGMIFDPKSDIGSFLLSIPLPIGISFFTFHGISLLVDVYRKKNLELYGHVIERSIWKHGLITSLYIAFFPQLVSGPITKSYAFLPQITHKFFKDIRWEEAFKNLVLGYFMKMVIADNLKDQTFWINFPYFQAYSTPTLLVMLFGYSMQIFSDFAGYSMIALGLGELFGYHLPVNFKFPYISRTFSEFWTRWHISLSAWLREYLYFPLGGNRKGKFRTYLNLMIVMFLGGFWHGAAWSYAIWGSFHGLALGVEKFLGEYIKPKDTAIVKFLQMLAVFMFVTFAWLLFKLPNFNEAVLYVKAIFSHTHSGQTNYTIIFYILLYSLPAVLFHLFHLSEAWCQKNFGKLKPVFYGLLIFAILVNSGSSGSFIYFQF